MQAPDPNYADMRHLRKVIRGHPELPSAGPRESRRTLSRSRNCIVSHSIHVLCIGSPFTQFDGGCHLVETAVTHGLYIRIVSLGMEPHLEGGKEPHPPRPGMPRWSEMPVDVVQRRVV